MQARSCFDVIHRRLVGSEGRPSNRSFSPVRHPIIQATIECPVRLYLGVGGLRMVSSGHGVSPAARIHSAAANIRIKFAYSYLKGLMSPEGLL